MFDLGKTSVRGYEWELSFLEPLGLRTDIPIFITETGWKRKARLSDAEIADQFAAAFSQVWTIP